MSFNVGDRVKCIDITGCLIGTGYDVSEFLELGKEYEVREVNNDYYELPNIRIRDYGYIFNGARFKKVHIKQTEERLLEMAAIADRLKRERDRAVALLSALVTTDGDYCWDTRVIKDIDEGRDLE